MEKTVTRELPAAREKPQFHSGHIYSREIPQTPHLCIAILLFARQSPGLMESNKVVMYLAQS
jgi:hypothetical protein